MDHQAFAQLLGNYGEFVGAIAVVVTLAYLAIQIRQNTIATRYQTTQNLVAANSDGNYLMATEGELAEIVTKGIYDRDQLSEVELFRFNTFFFGYYNHFDFAYHQFKAGQMEALMWRKMEYEIPLFLSGLPGMRHWWEADMQRFSDEFVKYIDQLLERMPAQSSLPTAPRPPAH